ncbi:MAG: redoxin family protein [Patescibacteria group bacterium]
MVNAKSYILIAVVALIVGAIYFITGTGVKRSGLNEAETVTPRIVSGSGDMRKEEKSNTYELAKEITTPDGFINTDNKPITIKELIGKKVILVDFWTYSCINCQRTTPYLNAWYEKYKDTGFVIIGMHTPEFEFEKEYGNVATAVEKFGIKFPVVLDNDYSTWTAYKNRYWPRKYLIDIDGYIVYDHIGEGAYEETERKIQEALTERMAVLGERGAVVQELTQETVSRPTPRSPETYFGADRNEFFGSGAPGVSGSRNFVIPDTLNVSTLYLSGEWNIAGEFAQNISVGSKIIYKYAAKDVFLVSEAKETTTVEVRLDGKPLGAEAGADVVRTADGRTVVKIKEARLYRLIQGSQSEAGTLELIVPQPGLKAFAFTFG